MERRKISKHKRSAELARRFLAGVALLGLPGVALVGLSGVTAIGCTSEGDDVGSQIQEGLVPPPDPFVEPPNTIGLTIEGCNNGGNTPITPNGTLPNADGRFVCQDPAPLGGNDNPYTTGNLGKDWSELDLVPHRLTVTNSGAAAVYNVQIAADYENGPLGYDVITEPEIIPSGDLNGFSADGCAVDFTASDTVANVTGGAGQSIYRTLTITHPANSTCVVDFALRLAVGASGFPGASLQSYKFESEDFQTGKATISLPVNEIEPQTLAKEMTATQDTDFMWNITKGPQDAMLKFGDTCDPENDLTETVEITINWEILPGMPGMVMIVTNISATNPASRAIRVDVSDEIFSGAISLDVEDCEPVVVPANTTQVVCTHVFDAAADVTDLTDTATATYEDVATGIPVPGQTTAMASAPIQPGTETNTTATITDSESIVGVGLEYALDFDNSVLPPGDCTVDGLPYVADLVTGIGPPLGPADADLICVTDEDVIEETGSGTLFKIVTLDEPRIVDGELSDTAELLGSDGFEAEASASVSISSTATVALTIEKTIPDILQAGEEITCEFDITGPNDYSNSVAFTFVAFDTFKDTTLTGLEPGLYTVTESNEAGNCGGLEAVEETIMVDINLPTCAGTAEFFNDIPAGRRATAEVNKVTFPEGEEAGWEMTLSGETLSGDPVSRVVLTDGDPMTFDPFGVELEEGCYTITEVLRPGWDKTDCDLDSGPCEDDGEHVFCSFCVSYPRDFDEVFSCTYTNTQRGTIIVEKQTEPDGSGQLFNFMGDASGDIADGGTIEVTNIEPGTYTSTETVPAGWDLTDITCDDAASTNPSSGDLDTATATFELDPGETVKCTFTNTQRGTIIVEKQTDPVGSSQDFEFTGDAAAADPGLLDGEQIVVSDLPPDTYTSTETVPAGWDLTAIECDDGESDTPSSGATGTATATFGLDPGETVTCTFSNRERGMVELLKLTNGVESTMMWDFTLTGPEVDESDSSPPTTVDFGGAKLIPGDEYTLCEVGIPAGWTLEWQVDTDGDGTPDTIIPMVAGVDNDPVDPVTGYSRVYDPNYVDPPAQFTNDTRCVNFVVYPGETLAFQIDNQFPGGEPRTIGYWKNWNTCTNGNQPQTAADNGGPDEGWYILDDLLNNPGYTIGILQLGVDDCEAAVDLLDKRDIVSGKKKASDAAYGLAAQLLAAQLNLSAGAETCQAVVDAVNAGQNLLADIDFDGTGNYLKGKNGNALRAQANALAYTLDEYNNGFLCN